MEKKKLYIIIAVAAVVLIGLIILAVCLGADKPAGGNENTDGQKQTAAQTDEEGTEDTTAISEDITDRTDEDTTTGATEETATDGTEETEGKPDTNSNTNSNSNSNSNSDSNSDSDSDSNSNSNGDSDSDSDEEPDSNNNADSGSNSGGNTGVTVPTEPTFPDEYPYNVTFKEYKNMSKEERIAFCNSFKDTKEFNQWYKLAKKAYDESIVKIDIEDGKIDLGNIGTGSD